MSRRPTERQLARLEELLADRGMWQGATDRELADEVGVRVRTVRRVRRTASLPEVLGSVGALELLREYSFVTRDRREADEVILSALHDAVRVAYAENPSARPYPPPKRPTGPRRATPGRPGRRARTENGRGVSGAKGPETTATARRRVPSQPIGRHVDG